MRIAALLADPMCIWRLRRALRTALATEQAALSYYSDWDGLISDGRSGRFELCIVDPRFGASDSTAGFRMLELEHLKQVIGSDSIVLYANRPGDCLEKIGDERALGIPLLIFKDIDDDSGSILRALAGSAVRGRLGRLIGCGDHELPGTTARLILGIVAGWPPVESVETLARQSLVSGTTLRRRCRESQVRSPRELLRWSRVLEAAALASLGIRNRSRISHLVGFANPSSLSRLLRDLLALSAIEVLEDPGLELAIASFRERVIG